ncbi:hypothetical protein [Rhodothermus profundi]|uniref:Uncharacterized protein n=1 Tax=Rhodothermus profundi TaxID=633813 RepID=A0A1M6TRW1_9BACT|nr:hypothetical protein [Rhodothermus profundi]SHK59639.1 hypothetical protein SAMN04488087_1507 [Rhodothermus profundi]
MYLLPALVFVPILFFMLVWAVVTAGRILFPERPLPFDRDFSLRGWTVRPRYRAPVHVAAPRATVLQQVAQAAYHFEEGHSDGLPEAWVEDLWLRRN